MQRAKDIQLDCSKEAPVVCYRLVICNGKTILNISDKEKAKEVLKEETDSSEQLLDDSPGEPPASRSRSTCTTDDSSGDTCSRVTLDSVEAWLRVADRCFSGQEGPET